jgi:potassium channel LctB
MQEWIDKGGAVESTPTSVRIRLEASPAPRAARPTAQQRVLFTQIQGFVQSLADRPFNNLLSMWLMLVAVCGFVYWGLSALGYVSLLEAGHPLLPDFHGLSTAIYFSFVTATSVGFGDVTPAGLARVVAIVESVAALLVFGCVISKLVSDRQERMVEEIHRIAFEDRIGRVRMNLHMVLSELQSIAGACGNDSALGSKRCMARLESSAMVFEGELYAIHDLLFRPQQSPEAPVLEAILAGLAACLTEFADLVGNLPVEDERARTLLACTRSIRTLAGDICGECVPREYAPELKSWMDRIHDLSGQLAAPSA